MKNIDLYSKDVLISVVIPIHNTAPFLHDCIISITSQTYRNIEILCVDDCSDKETVRILDSEADIDDRISVVHLDRAVGAGEARNIGMSQASGEYIIFLDSDDYFEPELIESMYSDIERSSADICVCGFTCFDNCSRSDLYYYFPSETKGVTEGCFNLSQLDESGIIAFNMSPWNKMIRRAFLEDNDIHFQSLSSSNDLFFTVMCLLYANRIKYCSNRESLIHYRFNSNSQISNRRESINLYYAFENVISTVADTISKHSLAQIIYAYVFLAVGELNSCKDESVNREFYFKTQNLLNGVKKDIEIRNHVISRRMLYFMTLDYETKWFILAYDFLKQIKNNFRELSKNILIEDRILIWGNGAKSRALQRSLFEAGYENVRVTDIKNVNVGKKTQEGYLIIHTDNDLSEYNVIIATNHTIYEDLSKKGIESINLDDYCMFE